MQRIVVWRQLARRTAGKSIVKRTTSIFSFEWFLGKSGFALVSYAAIFASAFVPKELRRDKSLRLVKLAGNW